MSASLVGSEMCIRDRPSTRQPAGRLDWKGTGSSPPTARAQDPTGRLGRSCLLYTSDAADDM
eukprot:1709026-Alexandrium_andersonii.AAC.1